MTFALCRTAAKDEEAAARRYLGKTNYGLLPGSIPERTSYRAAQNTGHAITETDDDDLNARAEELLVALLDRLTVEIDTLRKQVAASKKIGKKRA